MFSRLSLSLLILLTASFAIERLSAQNFLQPQIVPTPGGWPVAVYSADLNADGSPDLIYIDQGASAIASTIHILLGDGQGGFHESAVLSTAGDSIAIGDFDGDGHLDLAWAAPGSTPQGICRPADTPIIVVYLARGSGNGTFAAATSDGGFPTLSCSDHPKPGFLTSAQLHRVGPSELLFEDVSSGVLYTMNTVGNCCTWATTGGPRFVAGTNAQTPDGNGPLTVKDLNGDGLCDVVLDNPLTGTADVFLSKGNSSFAPAFAISGVGPIYSVLIGDFSGDGVQDLIAEGSDGQFSIYAGRGDGTFSVEPSISSALGAGIYGGGRLIAVTNPDSRDQPAILAASPAGIAKLSFFSENGSRDYLTLTGIKNQGPGSSYAVADFNNDGMLDVAVNSPEGIAILYADTSNGNSYYHGLRSNDAFGITHPALSLTSVPYEGPPFPNAVTPSNVLVTATAGGADVLWIQPNGALSLSTELQSASPSVAGLIPTVQAGDFNGDGKLDLAFTATGLPLPSIGSGVAIAYGNGDGTFADPVAIPNPKPQNLLYGYSAVGDFNGDGVADLANIDTYFYDTLLGIRGGSPGSFTTGFNCSEDGTVPGSNATIPDCTVTTNLTSQDLDSFSQVAAGAFKQGRTNKQDLLFQDLNELIPFVNSGDGIHFLRQQVLRGTPLAYGTTAQPLVFAAPGQILLADVDGDGNADVIAPMYSVAGATPTSPSQLYIWYGDGTGTFGDPVIMPLGRNYYLAVAGDLNGDGQPDIALSDGYLVAVLYNQGHRVFGDEIHLLAGQGINQLALADLNGDGNLDLLAANGGAVIASPLARGGALPAGVLQPVGKNPDVDNGAVTVLLSRLDAKGTTVSVKAAPEPSAYGAPFILSAIVTPPVSFQGTLPSGSVGFAVDGVSVAAGQISNGVAMSNEISTTLTPGVHTISATYLGDANFHPSVPAFGSHAVERAPTTTMLTPTTPLTVYYGQGIDGTYQIRSNGNEVTEGQYTLLDNAAPVANCTALPVGTPCPYGNPQLLDAGSHAFVLEYLGTAFFAPSQSAPVTYLILPDLTQATLVSSRNPAAVGDAVTFTAQLTGNFALPVGPVQFLDEGAVVGTAALVGGSASFTTSSLSRGTHAITAIYAGTLDFLPASTTPLSQRIVAVPPKLATAVTLLSDQNPSPAGVVVTFTASVSVPGPFPIAASGIVTFFDGTTQIGSSPLDAYGVARLQTSTLEPGSHPITAAYAGALNDTSRGNTSTLLPSVSPVLTEIITNQLRAAPVGFVLTVSPTPVTIGPGRAAVLLADVRAVSGFAQPVALTCLGLPPETTCLFVQPVIPPGGGSTTVQVLTSAPHDCGNPGQPYFIGWLGPGALPFLAGLLLLLVPTRKRLGGWRVLAALLALGLGATSVSGCGHCTDLGTKPGDYTFTVVGTAQGGPVSQVQMQKVKLTVALP